MMYSTPDMSIVVLLNVAPCMKMDTICSSKTLVSTRPQNVTIQKTTFDIFMPMRSSTLDNLCVAMPDIAHSDLTKSNEGISKLSGGEFNWLHKAIVEFQSHKDAEIYKKT